MLLEHQGETNMKDQFLTWASGIFGETNCATSKNVLSDFHFSNLLKAKNMKSILSYLINHVRPTAERNHIRLNLKHSTLRKQMVEYPEDGANMLKKVMFISRVQDKKALVQSEMEELLEIFCEREKLVLKERQLLNQISILKIAVGKADKEMKQCKTWDSQIPELLPKQNFSILSPNENSIKFDSIKEQILNINFQLLKIRQSFLTGTVNDCHDEKLRICQMVEQLLDTYSPNQIIKALESVTEADLDQVRSITSQVDLQKDAKALRFKYESSGQFIDEIGSGGVLETVQMLLVQMNGMHIKSHFKNYQLKKEFKSTLESLSSVKKSIGITVEETCKGDLLRKHDIMNYMEETISVEALRAALLRASKLSKEFETREQHANNTLRLTTEKYSKILCFNNKVKSGMEDLLNLNSGIEHSWDILKDDLSSIHSLLKGHLKIIDLPINISDFSLFQEMQAFLGIQLEMLNTNKTNKCPADPIQSCLQRNNFEGMIENSLIKLAPILTSWEILAEIVRQKKILLRCNQKDVSRELKSFNQMKSHVHEKDISSSNIKELYQKTKDFDKSLERKVIPLLDTLEEIPTMTNEKLKDLKDAVHDWWTQPAQYISKHL